MKTTTKQRKAAALGYDAEKDLAPRVLASGKGRVSEKILEIAKEHNIPIHEDPDLVDLLASLNIGETIPPELYKLVAEIITYLYEIDGDFKMVKKK
ncbi:MAG: EscU/YscU/HrcU family type III secretion system export apparatus switch protein [Candidatus Eremiobacteraeota bacterium]|nr:EscU/YscU/HrcU family type III secretion system export apparatus switch protein [Candidatus Eremiobacteraeota bacterium]